MSVIRTGFWTVLSLLALGGIVAFPAHATPPPSKAGEVREGTDAQNVALEALFDGLQKLPGIEAEFTEEKHLQLLALPLESKGVLYFHKEGYLLRKITHPTPSSVRISPTALTIDEDGKMQHIALSNHQEIAHIVQSFLWILAGDLSSLRKHFSLEFQKDASNSKALGSWTLILKPTDERVKKLVQKITVHGDGVQVKELRIEEQGGDATHTHIQRVNTDRHFSQEEQKSLFGRSK